MTTTDEGFYDSKNAEHADQGKCCECGGDHTCQDCPVFVGEAPA